jgi:hypothetical protein
MGIVSFRLLERDSSVLYVGTDVRKRWAERHVTSIAFNLIRVIHRSADSKDTECTWPSNNDYITKIKRIKAIPVTGRGGL